MDPQPVDGSETLDWGIPGESGVAAVETLNRFLGAAVRETWDDLDRALRITESIPEFSGILPLGDPTLRPYLNKPGIFFILGPQPALPLLHIGASRGPIGFVLRSRIEERPEGGYGWRWESRSDQPPTFAAIATMEDYWAFAPPLRNLLAKRLGGGPPEGSGPDELHPFV
jgi:hypothetical protein